MNRALVVVVWLYGMGTAQAACVTVLTPGVPRSDRQATAFALAAAAGHPELPSDGQGHQVGQGTSQDICFTSFDPTGIITDATMLAQFTSDDTVRQAANAAAQQKETDAKSETAANAVCQASLATINAQVDGLTTPADLKGFLKTFVRCFVSLRDRGMGR